MKLLKITIIMLLAFFFLPQANAQTGLPNGSPCDSNAVCESNYCVGTGTIPKTCQPPGTIPQAPTSTPTPAGCTSASVSSSNYLYSQCTGSVYGIGFTCSDGYSSQIAGDYCATASQISLSQQAQSTCAARTFCPTPTPTQIPTVLTATPTPVVPSITPTTQLISCPAASNVDIAGGSSSVNVTFDMRAPISAKTDGPIASVTYVSGNWCAWSPLDTVNYPKCPLPCPLAPGSGYPFSIAADKLSFSSNFDWPYPDNTGTCTYAVSCTAPSTTTTPVCPLKPQGDANCDGKINLLDFNQWKAEFLVTVTTKQSDFNNDNVINLLDFNIWKAGFLNPSLSH